MLNQLLGIQPNASEHGVHIDQMLEFLHWFMLLLFIGWSVFFVYCLVRFHRSRNPVASYTGARTKATTHLEATVILVEAVLLLGFAFPLWARRVNEFPTAEALRVRVVAQQFLFNFHYAGPDGLFGAQDARLVTGDNPLGLDRNDPAAQDDIMTMNDLHVPVDRPVILELHSKDVIHNVSIHHMRSSHDVIPGSMIPMWFTPVKAGTYEIVCGQLCGLGHFSMRAMLSVVTEEEFGQWLGRMAALTQPAAPEETPDLSGEEQPAGAPPPPGVPLQR